MKNVIILLFSVLALAACSQSKTDTSSTTNSSKTTAVSTTVSQSSSSQETSSDIQGDSYDDSHDDTQGESRDESYDDSVSYAVNLDDFIQEIPWEEGSKRTLYDLSFESKQKNQPPTIVLNTKDLNNEGKAVYITTTAGDVIFYPVSIVEEPTKTIAVTNNAGEKREIKVNTVVRVVAPYDKSDPLQIVGDTYFLFYNNQGTISLATRNFYENTAGTTLDTTNMVEYLQANSSAETSSTTPVEDETKSEAYYDSIRTAWQKQKDYIDSIDDNAVKQSVQTSHSAAIFEANRLEMKYPEDADMINQSLQKVLAGE